MRWSTHRSIGVAVYSIMVSFIYKPINIGYEGILGMLMFVPYLTSTLPDQLEKILGFKHRSGLHSLVGSIAIGTLLSLPFILSYSKFISTLINDFIPLLAPVIGIITGYLFHVLGDALTDNGVHLFWPYQRDKKRKALYKLWSYKAGENKEATIVLVAAILTIIIWVVRYIMSFINGINSALT